MSSLKELVLSKLQLAEQTVAGWGKINLQKFRNLVFFRVTTLSVTVLGFTIALSATGYTMTAIGLGALVAYQVVGLVKLVENTNREVVNFLNAIRLDDFSYHYKINLEGDTFDELNASFEKVFERFREVRAEKEANYQYLKTIIHHVGIGILSFDKTGKVQILNTAAKRLFQTNALQHIEQLGHFSEDLLAKIKKIRTGGRELVKIVHGAEIIQLAMYAIELNLRGEEYKLVTFQNIHNELEEQEMEAWQKLIRVLTHEIMNSVTPISSLAATIEGELEYLKSNAGQNEPPDFEDLQLAVKTIQRRSDAMLRFVSDFRNLTHVPMPNFKNVAVSELFDHIKMLMQYEISQGNIQFSCYLDPESLMITADQEQIEQVLINLIKNAVQALAEIEKPEKMIVLIGKQDEKNRPVIIVHDNGGGIDPEALERIFIPFFTTKKNGSGIGLSLSRQIMRQHKGTLTASSDAESGTNFVLKF